MDKFFFLVVAPNGGVVSGQLFAANALKASHIVKKLYPEAIEFQVRKEKTRVAA